MTAGSAGGLFCPYKGLVQAGHSSDVERSTMRTFFSTGPKGPYLTFCVYLLTRKRVHVLFQRYLVFGYILL